MAISADAVMDSEALPVEQAPVEQAAPAPQAADPGLSVAPPAAAPNPSGAVMGNALNFFRDPERLAMAAQLAVQYNRPDALAWMQRGHAAQKENAIDAVAALSVGDKAKALQMFNATGSMRATAIEDHPSVKGTYTVLFEDGTRRDVDPKKEVLTFLTPPEQVKALHNDEVVQVRRELGSQVAATKQAALDQKTANDAAMREESLKRLALQGDLNVARINAANAQAGLTNARAGKVGAAPGEKPMSEQQRIALVHKAAREAMTVTDVMGKSSVPDQAALLQVRALAEVASKKDPDLDPAEAVARAKDKYEEIKAQVGTEVDDEIKKIKKGNWFGDAVEKEKGVSTEVWRAKEVKARTDKLLRSQTPDPSSGTPAGAPPNVPALKYKEGDKLRSKKDGRNYVIRGGQPVLDTEQPKGR